MYKIRFLGAAITRALLVTSGSTGWTRGLVLNQSPLLSYNLTLLLNIPVKAIVLLIILT